VRVAPLRDMYAHDEAVHAKYLAFSDTLFAQAFAALTMDKTNPETRLNKLRGFGLEYALADIARFRLETDSTVFGLPMKPWVVSDNWCGDEIDIDLLLVEPQAHHEEEPQFNLFDEGAHENNTEELKRDDLPPKPMMFAMTLKVDAKALLDSSHISAFLEALQPFSDKFQVCIGLGCLLTPSHELQDALLRNWTTALHAYDKLHLHPSIVSLQAELEQGPSFNVVEVRNKEKVSDHVRRELLETQLKEILADHQRVRLQGHRQIGKTALAKGVLAGFFFFVAE
jgi:hypothetical protein